MTVQQPEGSVQIEVCVCQSNTNIILNSLYTCYHTRRSMPASKREENVRWDFI